MAPFNLFFPEGQGEAPLKIMKSEELAKLVRFAPDVTAQTAGDRLVLTLFEVFQIVGEAVIGRFPDAIEEARRIKRPARKKVGTSLGAWDLVQGVYWVTYNETVHLPEGAILYLENHPSLATNGVWQATRGVSSWEEVSGTLLRVGAKGVHFSEGAPVSTCLVARL